MRYGHSRSSKLVLIDFLLVLYCIYMYMPIFYRFRDIMTYWLEIFGFRRFYSTQSRLKPPSQGVPCDLGYESCESLGYPVVKTRDVMSIYFHMVRACDRRTYRWTDRRRHLSRAVCSSIAEREKVRALECTATHNLKTNKNLAIANRSRVSCACNTSRGSIATLKSRLRVTQGN